MKIVTSMLLLVLLVPSAIATENTQAQTWLERLSQSLKELNFNTSFVVVKNNQAEPYHWFHGVDENKKELEILSLLNGPRRDILRKGNIVSYIEPELPPYSILAENISGPIPAIFSQDISILKSNYEFISVGRSRVLGKTAQLVRIVSKDPHRFGHWLWLDQESALPLKMALITRKGKLLEQVQFTHLDITEAPVESLKQLAVAELPQVIDIPQTETPPFAWQIGWLPSGFKAIKTNRHRIAHTKQPVEFMLFSDGLVDISVYIGTSADAQRNVEYVMNGATVVLNQVTNGYEISVVGKIPSQTAKTIADSVTFTQQGKP